MAPPITSTESAKVQTTQNSVVETQQEQLKGRSGLVSQGQGNPALCWAAASEDCRCGSGTWGWSAHCRTCVRQRSPPGSVANLRSVVACSSSGAAEVWDDEIFPYSVTISFAIIWDLGPVRYSIGTYAALMLC